VPADGFWNREIETMPAREKRAMQTRRLRRQLADLSERSRFYARKFAAAGFDPLAVRSIANLAMPRLPTSRSCAKASSARRRSATTRRSS
jgi:phenylacetate-coenzyme A ligase PaaK-like adenylate-forming protein